MYPTFSIKHDCPVGGAQEVGGGTPPDPFDACPSLLGAAHLPRFMWVRVTAAFLITLNKAAGRKPVASSALNQGARQHPTTGRELHFPRVASPRETSPRWPRGESLWGRLKKVRKSSPNQKGDLAWIVWQIKSPSL